MSDRGTNIRNNISDEYEKTPGYLLWDISESVGQEMDEQDQEIINVRALFNVDNLSGELLERTVKQRKGIERKPATYAAGELQITGNGTVTKGDLFETENGVQFQATETVVIDDTGSVKIAALISGNSGVVGAGTITEMPVTLAGIVSCTNEAATHDGYDEEMDDSLRERYYAKLRAPDNGSNKYAYRNWALEVPGVGDAEVYPLGHGENTVDVVIIDDDRLPASEMLVSAVQTYIDPNSAGKGEGTAAMGAHCYVSSATGMDISITGKLIVTGDADTVDAAVKDSVKRYLASIAFAMLGDKRTSVSYAQISNYIIDTPGVLDVENLQVNGGVANIAVQDRYVAVLGTAVFTHA